MFVRTTLITGVIASLLLFSGVFVSAQEAEGKQLVVKIVKITGKAQFRNSEQEEWQPLKEDSPLSVGSEIRTGLRSSVQLSLGEQSDMLIKALSTIGLAELTVDEANQTIRTRVAQKYGNMHIKVNRVGNLDNDYQVATPNAVLAVKGSDGNIQSYGQVWGVDWQSGKAQQFVDGQTKQLSPNDQTGNDNIDPNAAPGGGGNILTGGDDQQGGEGGNTTSLRDGNDGLRSTTGDRPDDDDRNNGGDVIIGPE